ncbi:hypothetical protein PUN28_013939 [Cardiocondyla obscurior]|uniref:Uncharacterized protein n=1 Tax=Cardiocondyla obscurior TaxID=286306 RepID=A0AAW2F610_9HYME
MSEQNLYEDRVKNYISVTYPAIGRIFVDGEPTYEVEIKNMLRLQIPHTQPSLIDPEEIKIKGFINIEKRLTIRRERQKDQAYNKYMWMSPPNDGNDFGLRELFGLEYDAAFAPESWD